MRLLSVCCLVVLSHLYTSTTHLSFSTHDRIFLLNNFTSLL